jgi:hypothetical protein
VEERTAFEAARASGSSQRAFARERGVARTTLQYWLARKAGLDASPTLVAFFESPEGVAFLHRLVVVLHLVMSFVGPCGLRLIAQVLDWSGLGPFVANSLGSHHKLSVAMEAQTRAFGAAERTRLSSQLTPKTITVCEDETFHPAPCLVAIEPVSNFILLESYAESRDAETWNERLGAAIEALPIRPIQSTSDEGKALLAHVAKGLGAHHSPDLFHGQRELSRATSLALATQVRQAEQASEQAHAALQRTQQQAQAWAETPRGPGRPPDFASRIVQAQAAHQRAEHSLCTARQRQERARQAIRTLGAVYHPVDLKTGALRSPARLQEELDEQFTAIAAVATEASLPERCHQAIRKARRLVPALVATLSFFHHEVRARIARLALSAEAAYAVEQFLVPAAYLERAAAKARPADARPPLRALAARLRAVPEAAALVGDALAAVVAECADLFQRASSCVEGRNGQLALRHHSLHHITPTRLEALTVIHNYVLQRPDGTTAAERFFGARPKNLLAHLLDNLSMPARPAANRRHASCPPAPN